MAETIPNLWPEDINVDVATPLAILRAQVAPLERATKGNLSVDISTHRDNSSGNLVHTMDLVAAPLNNLHYTLVNVSHSKERVYPAFVDAPCVTYDAPFMNEYGDKVTTLEVANEGQFIEALREVLTSRDVRSLIDSMLARINEEPRLQKAANPVQ